MASAAADMPKAGSHQRDGAHLPIDETRQDGSRSKWRPFFCLGLRDLRHSAVELPSLLVLRGMAAQRTTILSSTRAGSSVIPSSRRRSAVGKSFPVFRELRRLFSLMREANKSAPANRTRQLVQMRQHRYRRAPQTRNPAPVALFGGIV